MTLIGTERMKVDTDITTDEATAPAPSPVTLYESPESAAVALRGWAGTLASDNYVLGEDERYRLVADLRGAVAVLAEVQPHLTSSVRRGTLRGYADGVSVVARYVRSYVTPAGVGAPEASRLVDALLSMQHRSAESART